MKNEMREILIFTLDDLIERTKSIESLIRKSPEYREYLKYIKENLQIRNCDYFKAIDFVENDLSVEVHHLITLYDLVQIAGTDLILKNPDGILPIDVVKAVINLHLNDEIPIILLSKTIHELYHAGLYTLDKTSKSVNIGDYTSFITKYGYLLTQKDIDILTYFDVIDEKTKRGITSLWQQVLKENSQS